VQDAIEAVRSARTIAQPNPAFMEQLEYLARGIKALCPSMPHNASPRIHPTLGTVSYRRRDGHMCRGDIVPTADQSAWASNIDIVDSHDLQSYAGIQKWLQHVKRSALLAISGDRGAGAAHPWLETKCLQAEGNSEDGGQEEDPGEVWEEEDESSGSEHDDCEEGGEYV